MANPEHVGKLLEGVESWNKWRDKNPKTTPDFEEADFIFHKKANLGSLNFEGANLEGAILKGANLKRADLGAANLEGAILEIANLEEAVLRLANLRGAILSGANLAYANLEGAILQRANLKGTQLKQASLKRAWLWIANLEGAYLVQANFEGADVTGVTFSRSSRQNNFRGIRVASCYGSQIFSSFAQDQDYIDELRASGWWGWLKFVVWLVLADCGRSFLRWGTWSLILALAFGGLYFWMGPDLIETGRLPFSLKTMIYYSVVTFTTLGFGDILPKTENAAMIVMAEVIVGYIMLGGLVAIFANKVARRS